jgi:hypothetical protein
MDQYYPMATICPRQRNDIPTSSRLAIGSPCVREFPTLLQRVAAAIS